MAVARTQTPAKVPGQTGFFNALKPVSPLFAQTSRVNVARPAAQKRQQQRVVPPPVTPPVAPAKPTRQQVEKKLFGAPSTLGGITNDVVGAAKTYASPTNLVREASNPVLGNPIFGKVASFANTETNKGLAVLHKIGAPNAQGAASTNAGILDAVRGANAASLSSAMQEKVRHAMVFFAQNPSYKYDVPNIGIYSQADKAKAGLPPTATDADVIRKDFEPFLGHRDYLSTLVHNIPLNAVQLAAAPVGLAYLGSQTAQGKMGALKEFAREQYDFGKGAVEHPLGTAKTDPIGLATSVFGVGRLAGGLGGTLARTGVAGDAARAFATPAEREVMPAGFNAPGQQPINRGLTSPKLDERLAQAASDKLASSVGYFGNRLDKQRANALTRDATRESNRVQTENYEPAARANAKLNRKEMSVVTDFIGQGFHNMGEADAYFTKKLADHQAAKPLGPEPGVDPVVWASTERDLINKQKQAANLHKKFGDAPISGLAPKLQNALALNTKASRSAEGELQALKRKGSPIPLVGEDTALRRAYVVRARIDAELHGKPEAQHFLQTTNELNKLSAELKTATPARANAIQKRLDQVRAEASNAQSARLGQVNQRIGRLERVGTTQANATTPEIRSLGGTATERQQAQIVRHSAEVNRLGRQIDRAAKTLERKQNKPESIKTSEETLQARIEKKTAQREQLAATKPEDTNFRVAPSMGDVSEQARHADIEARTAARGRRPVGLELNRLKRDRARLEGSQALPSDIHNATTRRLEQRLAQTSTPDTLAAERDQVTREQEAALHQVRSQYRAERGAPPVTQGAPLDEHDPLFFQHVIEGPKFMQRVRTGAGIGTTSPNAAAKFAGGRLGHEGQQSTGALWAQGGASGDASVFTKGVEKPAAVAAKLNHYKAQVEDSIIAPKAGTGYDTRKYIDMTVPQSKVHTTVNADAAANESDETMRTKILSVFNHDAANASKSNGHTAYIPDDGQEHYLMTRNGYNNLDNSLKHYDSNTLRVMRKSTGIWRWATLMARPAWLVNNVAGNAVQAALAGVGPGDLYRAARKEKFPVPHGVENAGQYANVFDKPSGLGSLAMKPIHAFTRVVVDANVKSENFFRRAVAQHNLSLEAKAAVHGEFRTITTGFHRSTAAVKDYMANPSPEAATRVIKEVDRTMGNFTKLKQTPYLDVISPFHRWFRFIGQLTAEMPVKTPGRALLLQRLGQFGINIQNQAFGGFVANSLQGSLQLPQSLPLVGGLYKSTQGINPLATAFQTLAPNDQSTTDPGQPNFQGALGMLNPAFGAAWDAAAGTDFQTGATLKDQYGNPAGNFNPNVLGHELENAFPFATLASGYNTADTSLNPLRPQQGVRGALAQKPQSFADRALGYGLGSVRPYDPVLNQVSSFKRLLPAEKTAAKNRAKHGG